MKQVPKYIASLVKFSLVLLLANYLTYISSVQYLRSLNMVQPISVESINQIIIKTIVPASACINYIVQCLLFAIFLLAIWIWAINKAVNELENKKRIKHSRN